MHKAPDRKRNRGEGIEDRNEEECSVTFSRKGRARLRFAEPKNSDCATDQYDRNRQLVRL